jgi:hypothetical protein
MVELWCVMVSTDMTPMVTRAGVAPASIQNEIHERMTTSTLGKYTCTKK